MRRRGSDLRRPVRRRVSNAFWLTLCGITILLFIVLFSRENQKTSSRSAIIKAIFKSPKAMRGGISICFPQFGNCSSLEQQGFTRNKIWTIDDDAPPLLNFDVRGKSFVDLLLRPGEEEPKFWPHGFELRVRVSLASDGNLAVISRVRNINGKPFSFLFGYHTYLSLSDISEVRLEGLETLDYLDNLCQRERFTEQGDALTFESEAKEKKKLSGYYGAGAPYRAAEQAHFSSYKSYFQFAVRRPRILFNLGKKKHKAMATSLAAMAVRRAATFGPLSSPVSSARSASLITRRGLAGAADHHGPPKVDFWKDPMSPSKWKEEHFVIVSLSGWGLLLFGGYKFFTGGKKNNEEKLVEATH